MIGVNIDDVIAVLNNLKPHLITIAVVLVLAIAITIGVNRKTVKDTAVRKLIHSESWLVFMVATVVAVAMMLFGPLSSLLNLATNRHVLQESTISAANDLAAEVQQEAITLLKNDDDNLPLKDTKVNVFGWGSTNPVYGGTGSGSMSDAYPTVSILDGMRNAGLETNEDLSKLYTDYRTDRPVVAINDQDWTLPEVPADQYSDDLLSEAKDFSDQAVIVITRVGGEGSDLPTDMKGENIVYDENSPDYQDFEAGEHFLQLSQTERNMIDMVTSNFDDVTLVYNGANAFQFDFLDDYPQIASVLWCPPAGQTGFNALGDVLAGNTNPSGAYQPEASMSWAIRPIMSPNAEARSTFQVQANAVEHGKPMEPTPVNVLFSEAGPSRSVSAILPTESVAWVPKPAFALRLSMSSTDSWSSSWSHIGSS